MYDFGKTDFDKAIQTICSQREQDKESIERLEEENQRLKSENYKDDELLQMLDKYTEMKADYNRGFPISEKEIEKINEWQMEHLKKYHPQALENPGYFGAIGGNFRYEFIPTSIGTIGVIKCACGKDDFTFQNMV